MRNKKIYALMITLSLLSGCGQSNSAEQLALDIRSSYLACDTFSAHACLTADYGQRVYSYEMDVQVLDDATTLTLTQPDYAAGITASIEDGKSSLIYQDVSVETGALDPDGLTPVSAVPALLETVRSGFITSCMLEDSGLLRVDCGSPDAPAGTGTRTTLWFQPEDSTLVQGDILVDGARRITCTFSQVTKE